MQTMTITEALAEIKTINARVAKNLEFVRGYLIRDDRVRDPFEGDDGGSRVQVDRYRQSSHDLRERVIKLRAAIHQRNATQTLEIEGVTRTLADWIVWRREVAQNLKQEQDAIASWINAARAKQRQDAVAKPEQPLQIVVNLDERKLAEDRDRIEKILGHLDGQLSLRNATTFVEIE